MKRAIRPRVSIGLPVYNGENFLSRALDSIRAQTFTDYEVVISDNGSTDATERICRDYMGGDHRIRYVRQPVNIGVPGNFNAVFEQAGGEYFHWLAHDDLCRPEYLARCVGALDAHRDVVLAFSRAASIDHAGRRLKEWPARPELASPDPVRRFREILQRTEPFAIFGLVRADVLRKTGGYGSFWCADFALLAELTLRGRFMEIPEELFLLRQHGGRSTFVWDWRDPERATRTWNPRSARPFLAPHWTLLRAQARAVAGAPLGLVTRLRCGVALARHWSDADRRTELRDDLQRFLGRLPLVGSIVRRASGAWTLTRWRRRVRRAMRALRAATGSSGVVVMVDQASFGARELAGLSVVPFLERNGQYWGCPADDEQAIRELERARAGGARFLAVAWPAFWWLQHYESWGEHVRSRFPCLVQNADVQVFDLRAG